MTDRGFETALGLVNSSGDRVARVVGLAPDVPSAVLPLMGTRKVKIVDRIPCDVVVIVRASAFDGVDLEEPSEVGVVESDAHTGQVLCSTNVEPVMGAEPSETVRGCDTSAVFVGWCVRDECCVHVGDTNRVAMRVTDRPRAGGSRVVHRPQIRTDHIGRQVLGVCGTVTTTRVAEHDVLGDRVGGHIGHCTGQDTTRRRQRLERLSPTRHPPPPPPPLVVVGFSATSTNVHDAASDSVNVFVPDAPTVA